MKKKQTKKLIRYKVETLYSSGWGDAGWTENDKPMRFTNKDKANQAINELYLENNKENPINYRVVRV